MTTTCRTWLITGISRGLGRTLAQAVLRRGDRVIGTTRSGDSDLQPNPYLEVLKMDVADPEQIRAAMRIVRGRCRLDVVVNNAGYGLIGAVEELTTPQVYEMFAANFFGCFHVLQEVLPLLRAQRSGRIINISSASALAPPPGFGLYCASKTALEAMSEALAQELAPLGIHLSIVEPGQLRPDFLTTCSVQYARRSIADYAASSGRIVERLHQADGLQPGNPEAAAQAILDLADTESPPLRLLLGSDALHRARNTLAQTISEIDRWEDLTRSVDYVADVGAQRKLTQGAQRKVTHLVELKA